MTRVFLSMRMDMAASESDRVFGQSNFIRLAAERDLARPQICDQSFLERTSHTKEST